MRKHLALAVGSLFLASSCGLATAEGNDGVNGAKAPAASVALPGKTARHNPFLLLDPDVGQGVLVEGAMFTPAGDTAVVYGVDWGDPNKPDAKTVGKIELWDTRNGQKIREFTGHSDLVRTVKISPDGSLLASESQDGMIALWDFASGKLLAALSPAQPKIEFGPKMTMDDLRRSLESPHLLGFSEGGRSVLLTRSRFRPNEIGAEAQKETRQQATAIEAAVKPGIPLKRAVVQRCIEIWDVASRRKTRTLDLPGVFAIDQVTPALLAPDGKSVVYVMNRFSEQPGAPPKTAADATKGNRVEVYRVADGGLEKSIDLPPGARFSWGQSLSGDGRLLAVEEALPQKAGEEDAPSVDRLSLVDLNAARVQATWAGGPGPAGYGGPGSFRRVVFAPDGSTLATGTEGGTVEIHDVRDGHVLSTLSGGHLNEINTMSFAPDGQSLVSVGMGDSYVQVWNLTAPLSEVPGRTLTAVGNVRAMDFDQQGQVWSAAFSTTLVQTNGVELDRGTGLDVTTVDAATGAAKKVRIPNEYLIESAVFSHDHKLIAAAQSRETKPAFAEGAGFGVWDIATRQPLFLTPPNLYISNVLAFSPDDSVLAVDTPALWDVKTGKLLRNLEKSDSEMVSGLFSADGRVFIAGTQGGSVLFYDVATGKIMRRVTVDAAVRKLMFSPDGTRLATAGSVEVNRLPVGTNVQLWDMATGSRVQEFSIEGRTFNGLAFSADGKRLTIASFIENHSRRTDSRIELWDIDSQTLLGTVHDVGGLENPILSPDGRYLLASGARWLKVWNVDDVVKQAGKQ